MPVVSILVFLPLVAIACIALLPASRTHLARWLALGAVLMQILILCFGIFPQYTNLPSASVPAAPGFQLVEQADWIGFKLGSYGYLRIEYLVGLDGLNVLLVALTVLVMLLAVVASWHVAQRVQSYFALLLLLNLSLLGCFVALDFFLFYIFYEFMLLPMFLLIGMWGSERREYAAMKFFLYTLLGSVLMLVAIVALVFSTVDPAHTAVVSGLAPDVRSVTQEHVTAVLTALHAHRLPAEVQVHSFSMVNMANAATLVPDSILTVPVARTVAFLAFFIAFAIKLPSVPLHTWLPDAHVEASTPVSVVLAGVLLKVGGYGMLRICYGIFPDAGVALSTVLSVVAVISIVYGALVCLAQTDLKRLIAYSSVSHMGFVLLGIVSLDASGVSGAIFQMVAHGVSASMLFLLVGVLYDRVHDRQIQHFSGLWLKMPQFTGFVFVGFFAGLALPGLATFVSELLVFLGAFHAAYATVFIPKWVAYTAVTGVFLSAAYFLWALQRMFFGPYRVAGGEAWHAALTDVTPLEKATLVICATLLILFGLFPALALDYITPWAEHFVTQTAEVLAAWKK